VNPARRLLLSSFYGARAPEHTADLAKSGLTAETVAAQHIRSVPPAMIPQLLGFNPKQIRSAYLIPFPDPAGGGWLPHVRMKVFPAYTDRKGRTVKYLGPRGMPPRLFFPLATMAAALRSDAPLWCVEGAKKSLAAAQLGLAAVGFEGIEGWHVRDSLALLPDFGLLRLQGRVVELTPDGDVQTNQNVERGVLRLAEALEMRGAHVRVVLLPVQAEAAA